jgi:hypothetical protein
MPATQGLSEDGSMITIAYIDPWTVEELTAQFKQQSVWLNAADHKIHVLFDLSKTRQIPPGVLRARESPILKHPNCGRIAVFGASSTIKAFADVTLKITRFGRAGFFKTQEEALGFLAADTPVESKP